MRDDKKNEIEKICKEFAKEFEDTVGGISGSAWLIVDPLSGYLNSCGYDNKLIRLLPTDKNPMVLIMTFKDGTQFIPAGSDFPRPGTKNWMWIDPEKLKKNE